MIKGTNRHVIGEFPITNTDSIQSKCDSAYNTLCARTGEGAEMTDWLDWPKQYFLSDEYKRLKKTAQKIRNENNAVVVIGIGGSYLTGQAVINSELGEFYNEKCIAGIPGFRDKPCIYYAGYDLSPDRLNSIRESLIGQKWSIIYNSKSGGTIEPAEAFHTVWNLLYDEYGEEANQRVYAVTDKKSGKLKEMVDEHDWESFVIPDGIGGRYCAFTACGLLPVEIAGIDADRLLVGACQASSDFKDNPQGIFAQYAMNRFYNYMNGRKVEVFAMNTPDLSFVAEWLKQLFGESEGKDDKGIFPTSAVFPRDLHSLGQFLQEGTRDLIFETFIIRDFKINLNIPKNNLNDNLDKYEGKSFTQATEAAMDGAYKAHTEGGNPCSIIRVGYTLEDLGYFMQSMFMACALYCYMIEVNPFNQPGVQSHKDRMKASPKWDE